MERIPTELIYVLIFLGIIAFNFVVQQAARRRQQEAQAQAPEEPPPAEDEPLEDIWGRTPAPPPPPAVVARPAPPAIPAAPLPPRRLHPVRALLHDQRDLRRAVILMMVLGPCRSQEPPDR